GAFAASQDADTDGIEGLTFTWRAAEIREGLGDATDASATAYGVTAEGNWEGVTILSRVVSDEDLATKSDLPVTDIAERLADARARLLARRRDRPPPARPATALAA